MAPAAASAPAHMPPPPRPTTTTTTTLPPPPPPSTAQARHTPASAASGATAPPPAAAAAPAMVAVAAAAAGVGPDAIAGVARGAPVAADAIVRAAAAQLRGVLDAGAAPDDPRVASLLQLVNLARAARSAAAGTATAAAAQAQQHAPPRDRAAAFDADAAAFVSAMGLENADKLAPAQAAAPAAAVQLVDADGGAAAPTGAPPLSSSSSSSSLSADTRAKMTASSPPTTQNNGQGTKRLARSNNAAAIASTPPGCFTPHNPVPKQQHQQRRLRLYPKPVSSAMGKVLALVRADTRLGARVKRENQERYAASVRLRKVRTVQSTHGNSLAARRKKLMQFPNAAGEIPTYSDYLVQHGALLPSTQAAYHASPPSTMPIPLAQNALISSQTPPTSTPCQSHNLPLGSDQRNLASFTRFTQSSPQTNPQSLQPVPHSHLIVSVPSSEGQQQQSSHSQLHRYSQGPEPIHVPTLGQVHDGQQPPLQRLHGSAHQQTVPRPQETMAVGVESANTYTVQYQSAATTLYPLQGNFTNPGGVLSAAPCYAFPDPGTDALEYMFEFIGPLDDAFDDPRENLGSSATIRAVLAERERVLYTMVQLRQAQILSLPESISEGLRRKAVIDAKQLQHVEMQRALRHRVASEQLRLLSGPSDEMAATNIVADDIARMFRRRDPPVYSYTDGYPRISPLDGPGDLPARSQETIAMESARMAHFDYTRMAKQRCERRAVFLTKLMYHQQAFATYFGLAWHGRARILKGFERHWLDKKRAEERRKKHEQVERLRLLRSNDEEAYLKLLKDTKNQRLLQLVSQTDNYLLQIGARVERSRDAEASGPGAGENIFEVERARGNDDTVDSMRRRRDMYYTVTHAITEDVKQPSIMVHGQLKPYQVDGLKWMVSLYNNNLNGILADEMGLGKTIQTISLITYLMETKNNPGPYLIIVPLSTVGNWVRELDTWAPTVVKVVYRGDPSARRLIYNTQIAGGNFNIVLTTYEFVVKEQAVLGKIYWKYIIIDEGHRMKNANCKLAMTLGVRYRSRNRLLLTGTPLQNNLTELWALLNFLLPSIFSSADTFEQWFKKPFEQTTMGDAAELEEEETFLIINRLHQVLRPFLLRRLKTDVESQLPDKVESVIRCDMSIWQRVLYRQMQNRVALAMGDDGRSSRTFNNLLMQLKKICNHPFLFYGPEAIEKLPSESLIRACGKFSLLRHVLEKLSKTGHRTLIFSQMTSALDYLEDFLTLIDVQYMRLDGATKADDRQDMLNVFNAADSPFFCFLLSTRAGGLGLNLQTADTVIIFDSDWNPMMDLQAQDRAHRIGQTKEVRVFRLISSGTVEVKILDRANRKLQVDAQIIQAGQFNNQSTETDRETMLKSILRQKTDETDGLGDDCPDLEEVNRMLARSDEEFDLFQEMDTERTKQFGTNELMTLESELPSWILQAEIEHKTAEERTEEEMQSHGRGQRRRSSINDLDQLTEREWISVMEGNMTVDEAFTRRQMRIDRRRKRDASSEDELEEIEVDESSNDSDDENDSISEVAILSPTGQSATPKANGKRQRKRKRSCESRRRRDKPSKRMSNGVSFPDSSDAVDLTMNDMLVLETNQEPPAKCASKRQRSSVAQVSDEQQDGNQRSTKRRRLNGSIRRFSPLDVEVSDEKPDMSVPTGTPGVETAPLSSLGRSKRRRRSVKFADEGFDCSTHRSPKSGQTRTLLHRASEQNRIPAPATELEADSSDHGNDPQNTLLSANGRLPACNGDRDDPEDFTGSLATEAAARLQRRPKTRMRLRVRPPIMSKQ